MQTLHSSHRFYAVALLIAAALWLKPSEAQAFDLEGATIVIELELPDENGENFKITQDPIKIKEYFGLAHCLCTDIEFGIKFSLADSPGSFMESEQVDIWLGKTCDSMPADISVRNEGCESPQTFDDIEDLISPRYSRYPVHTLLAPNSLVCPEDTGTAKVWAIIDQGTDGIDGEDYVATPYEIPFDMKPPPAPLEITPSGAEKAIQIKWELPSRSEEIEDFQVLCARADGTVSEDDGFPGSLKPKYLTTRDVCQNNTDLVRPVGADGNDIANLPVSLGELSALTLCAETGKTQTGVRVEGLENDVPYRLVLLTIDAYRNVTATDLGEHTPAPVEDAWEYYQNQGGHAEGGYCFVATATYGNYDHPFVRVLRDFRDDTLAHTGWGRDFIAWYYDKSPALAAFISRHESARFVSYLLLAPVVAAAAIWEYTGVLGKLVLLLGFALLLRRRYARNSREPQSSERPWRPRRAVVVGLSCVLLGALGATAHAQPYWDELNEAVEEDSRISHWNFEVKIGPYFPDVDSEFDSGEGPFKEMFGTSANLMTVLVLDRFFLFPSGQLGVSASMGFNKQYAQAFALDDMGNVLRNGDGTAERSSGDRTKFRLFPTSIGAVYRFTRLDEEFNIPVIPYGRASLAYYLWYFSDPSGEVSEAPTDSCMDPGAPGSTCTGNRARGGTLGYQASIGIAVRAERLDPTAEVSLRTQMGIEHAGFFVELQAAQVDGFGSDTKLSVGDTTWFGGINFEF
jgi:hypothetical protein